MKRLMQLIIFCLTFATLGWSQCNFDIQLTDTYGDGWNLGTVDVYVDGVLQMNDLTFASGSGPVTFAIPATEGQIIEVFLDNAGSYPGEMRVEIVNDVCSSLYGPAAPSAAGSGPINAVCGANNPEYAVSGDATSPAPYECVELTQNLNNQAGCAWQYNVVLDFSADFVHDMTVNMGSDPNGADGLCFVIQNDPDGMCTCGGAGGGIGASGIQNSLIVELDTYLNFEDRDDGMTGINCSSSPNPDHMDLWLNGNVNPDLDGDCNATAPGERIIASAVPFTDNLSNYYEVSNGLDHTLRITWVASTQSFTAELMDDVPSGHVYGAVSYSFDPMVLFGTNTPNFGYTASTGGLSNDHTFCLPPQLLPVEIDYIHSDCEDGKVQISWRTLSERDASHFYLRGTNSFDEIKTLSSIQASGNSTEPINYDVFPSIQYKYYQLVQVDYNGQETEYEWISAFGCGTDEPTLFPNPANEIVKLRWSGTLGFTYDILSPDGKVIRTGRTQNENTSIDIQSLSPGTYIVSIYDDFSSYTKKLIIQ